MRYRKGRYGYHLLKHFQCEVRIFWNMLGRYPKIQHLDNNKLMVTIWRSSLETCCSWEPGILRGNLTMLENMFLETRKELVLEIWLPLFEPYLLMDEMVIGVSSVTLRFYLRK